MGRTIEIGEKIGRWTVLRETRKNGKKHLECRCECGTVREVYYWTLAKGESLSCGCLRRELKIAGARDLTGHRFGMLVVLHRDPEQHGFWVCQCDCGRKTSVRGTSLTKQKKATQSCGCIQREAAVKQGIQSIGKNAEKQITINKAMKTNIQVIKTKTPPKNNKSGMKGIWWDESRQMWQAYIQLHGKRKHLGRYVKKEDAIAARREAEELYFEPLLREAKIKEE